MEGNDKAGLRECRRAFLCRRRLFLKHDVTNLQRRAALRASGMRELCALLADSTAGTRVAMQ